MAITRRSALWWLAGAAACRRHPGTVSRIATIVAPWELRGSTTASVTTFLRLGVGEALTAPADGGGAAGALAESWSLASDRLTWRFLLRENVRRHDGSPLTARTVVRILEGLRDQTALRNAPIEYLTAENTRTVLIRTARPFSPLAMYLCSTPVMDISWDPRGQSLHAIGTGPYRVVEMDGSTRLDLEAFPAYWGARPELRRIRYLGVASPESRAWMAQSGEADVVFTLSPVSAERLRRTKQTELVDVRMARIRILKFNCGSQFFSDPRVRLAISSAIDRRGIADGILHDGGSAASQLFPPEMTGWHQPGLSCPYQPDHSRRLLAEAGWTPGPDGIVVRNGRPFHVELLTYSSRPDLPEIAVAIQAQLRAVGILVDILIGESSAISDAHGQGSLQMALLARSLGAMPDPIGTLTSDFMEGGGEFGAMNWRNYDAQRAIAGYLASFDEKERQLFRRQIATTLNQELPVVPLAWYQDHISVSSRVSGFVADPYELHYSLERLRWKP